MNWKSRWQSMRTIRKTFNYYAYEAYDDETEEFINSLRSHDFNSHELRCYFDEYINNIMYLRKRCEKQRLRHQYICESAGRKITLKL